jgi:hypothetical protein
MFKLISWAVRHLNSPVFQQMYLPYKEEEDSGAPAEDVEVVVTREPSISGEECAPMENDLHSEVESHDQTSGANGQETSLAPSEIDETARGEAPASSDEPAAGTELPDENVEAIVKDTSQNDGAPQNGEVTEEVEVYDPFADNEDDYEDEDDDVRASMERHVEKPRTRYEITHWAYHVREAERYWSDEETKDNTDWKELWDLLETFLASRAFKPWKKTQWDQADDDDLPLTFWYSEDSLRPLHASTGLGLKKLTRELLSRDHNVNEVTEYGEAPLHFAAKAKVLDMEMLQILFEHKGEHKADPNLQCQGVFMASPFFYLLQNNPNAEAVELFIQHGADCVKKIEFESPLHTFALKGRDPKVLDLLMGHGALINETDWAGETPLHNLLGRSDVPLDLLRAFLARGADLSIDDRNSQRQSILF